MKKAIIVFVFIISQLGLFSQAPAYFTAVGKTGTGNCDGTILVQSCCFPTYTFSPGGMTGAINYSNLCPITYTAGINCSSGSSYFFTITYGVNTATVGNFSTGTNVLAGFTHFVPPTIPFPNCNGMLVLDIQGGLAPYTITWKDSLWNTLIGQNNDTLFNVCSGNYVFTLKDNSTNCYGTGGSTTISTAQKREIDIYPNPANNKIFIEGISKNSTIKISTILGEILLEAQLQTDNLDISNLKEGIYFLDVIQGNKIIERNKFIISR